jgi:hypothetical protein
MKRVNTQEFGRKRLIPAISKNINFQVANLQRRDLCPDIAVMLAWIEQAKILTRELK